MKLFGKIKRRKEKIMEHKQFKDFGIEDFIDMGSLPKRELKPGQKVRCTFYKIKPGSYKPERREHQITDMPKELYEAFFQARVA